MRLQELVEVSNAVAQVSGRLEKTARLAEFLLRLRDREIDIGVAFLSGSLTQGRVGLGWAAVSEARKEDAAAAPSLELREVDESFGRIARTSGAGSARERIGLLGALFARATAAEQDFLTRLLSGDLRQGALEGVLVEAIAKAVRSPAVAIRNAAMMAGDLGEVARVALQEGPSALSRYAIQLFRPVQPMLAESAEGVREASEVLGEAAFEYKLDGARIQVHSRGRFQRHPGKSAISWRARATFRAREGISPGQAGKRGRYPCGRSRDLRGDDGQGASRAAALNRIA